MFQQKQKHCCSNQGGTEKTKQAKTIVNHGTDVRFFFVFISAHLKMMTLKLHEDGDGEEKNNEMRFDYPILSPETHHFHNRNLRDSFWKNVKALKN